MNEDIIWLFIRRETVWYCTVVIFLQYLTWMLSYMTLIHILDAYEDFWIWCCQRQQSNLKIKQSTPFLRPWVELFQQGKPKQHMSCRGGAYPVQTPTNKSYKSISITLLFTGEGSPVAKWALNSMKAYQMPPVPEPPFFPTEPSHGPAGQAYICTL
jgi:hypothetical protein